MTPIAPVIPAVIFVAAAVMLGGSATEGVYGNAAIQIAAALGIALAIVTRQTYPGGTQRILLALILAMIGLGMAQLVPLPPALWTSFAGRGLVVDGMRLAGVAPGWAPLSLAPRGTIGATLAIVPVLAAALIGMRAPRIGLIALFVMIVLMMMLSVGVGIGQRMGGPESPLYFYDITNAGDAVGFFANMNHFATLCTVSIPIAAALFVARRGSTQVSANWLMLLAIVVAALFGAWFSTSDAGMGLSAISLISLVLILRLRRGNSTLRLGLTIVVGLVVVATLVAVGTLVWARIEQTGFGPGGEMGRPQLWTRTIRAIWEYMPWGSGMGSFTTVFPHFENALAATRIYANHAHNDWLEVVMEGGAPAVLLMLAFAIWWLRTTFMVWTAPTRDAFSEAATVVTAIVMLHELVDYPLRTAAIAVIFGLCCGVMARPRRIVEPEDKPERASRHLAA